MVHTSFEADDRDAETKVATAIAWLERGQFLRRRENHTRIFPARLRLRAEDANKRLAEAGLPARRLEEYRATLNFLYAARADERIDTDQLMQLTGQTSEGKRHPPAARGTRPIGERRPDPLYLRHGISGASGERLKLPGARDGAARAVH